MKLAVLSLLLSGAAAFTVPQAPAFSTRLFEEAEAAEEVEVAAPVEAAPTYECISKEAVLAAPNTIEVGRVWDPLGLAENAGPETLAWYRHAEVKHGRVAMAAFVGWWVVGAGIRLPGQLATDLDFASIPSKGLEAWDAVPGWGKVQMLLFAGLIEFHDELFHSRRGTHYLRGGIPGKVSLMKIFWRSLTLYIAFFINFSFNIVINFDSLLYRTWFQDFTIPLDSPTRSLKRPRQRDVTVRSRMDVLLCLELPDSTRLSQSRDPFPFSLHANQLISENARLTMTISPYRGLRPV